MEGRRATRRGQIEDAEMMIPDRRRRRDRRVPLYCVYALMLAAISGCSDYMTPARGVSMATLADADEGIRERMLRKPAAPFPARMATVRVQAPRYRSNSAESYGYGRYSVVTTRDIEREEDFLRLRNPQSDLFLWRSVPPYDSAP